MEYQLGNKVMYYTNDGCVRVGTIVAVEHEGYYITQADYKNFVKFDMIIQRVI